MSRPLYRVLNATLQGYTLVAFWVFMAMFLLAFVSMFVFPPLSIMLVFVGLFGLFGAWAGHRVLGLVVGRIARLLLGGGMCPACGETGVESPPCQCAACGGRFGPEGLQMREEATPASPAAMP
jgi:hypothetical protein